MEKYTHGVDVSTYDMLFSDFDKGLRESTKCSRAFLIIDEFTKIDKKNYDEVGYKTANEIYNDKITKDKNGRFQYQEENFVICFYKLSDFFNAQFHVQELVSENRRNKSYVKTVNMAPYIPNGDVLTGYINLLGNDVIHSVIELPNENGSIILDWYLNTLMTKQDYLKLTNFREISKIKHDDLISDKEMRLEYMLGLSSEMYLLFRDEIVQDIEKNKRLFKTI